MEGKRGVQRLGRRNRGPEARYVLRLRFVRLKPVARCLIGLAHSTITQRIRQAVGRRQPGILRCDNRSWWRRCSGGTHSKAILSGRNYMASIEGAQAAAIVEGVALQRPQRISEKLCRLLLVAGLPMDLWLMDLDELAGSLTTE